MGSNSIQCSVCKCWVQHGKKRCTKIKGPLPRKIADIERFVCAVCKGDHVVNDQPVNVNFEKESLELVDKFCYLEDTISAGGEAEAATISKTRCGWVKFRELRPLLTMRRLPLHLKGKIYTGFPLKPRNA